MVKGLEIYIKKCLEWKSNIDIEYKNQGFLSVKAHN